MLGIPINKELNIVSVMLCEDTRPELNGKWTLLGAFAGDISVQSLPANVKLALFLETQFKKPYKGPFNVRFCLDETEVFKIDGSIDCPVGFMAVPVGPYLIPFQKAGLISADVSVDGKSWTQVFQKGFALGNFKDGLIISPSA